ncbi:MAG: hypothetical protein R3348_06960 [Xanthomonadales bacterium]|nr:hypothetical protein [Xanthomonadales bacterium]
MGGSSALKTAVITTVGHNVGDDFVRAGILCLLGQVHESLPGEVELIHKHAPATAVYGLERIRSRRVSELVEPVARALHLRNRISAADLLVQSGAPIYWCHPGLAHCAENEWYQPLIRKRWATDRRGRKLLNIAGGSCQHYHSDGSEVSQCAICKPYISALFDICDLTILRDEVARAMLKHAGRDAPVLPCTSIFARDYFGVEPGEGEYIVLNYMEGAGHYRFDANIDAERWAQTFIKLAREAARLGKVVLACHDERELRLAQELLPDFETYAVPDDARRFMDFYARARFGVVNRVHSAFMLASLGKPAVVVGNDTRARMISELGLTSVFVDDANDPAQLLQYVLDREDSYPEISDQIRHRSMEQYTELIASAL